MGSMGRLRSECYAVRAVLSGALAARAAPPREGAPDGGLPPETGPQDRPAVAREIDDDATVELGFADPEQRRRRGRRRRLRHAPSLASARHFHHNQHGSSS